MYMYTYIYTVYIYIYMYVYVYVHIYIYHHFYASYFAEAAPEDADERLLYVSIQELAKRPHIAAGQA